MGVQIFVWDNDFISFGYIPRSGIVGSYDSSVFNFLKNLYTGFYSSYTSLYSQCFLFSISLLTFITCVFVNEHPNTCKVISHLLFWFAHPWLLVMLSTFSCTSWPFVCLLCKNVCSRPLPILKSDYLLFWLLSSIHTLYIWEINLLSDIFCLLFCCCIFILFVLLQCRRFLFWCSPSLFLLLLPLLLMSNLPPPKKLPKPMSMILSSIAFFYEFYDFRSHV